MSVTTTQRRQVFDCFRRPSDVHFADRFGAERSRLPPHELTHALTSSWGDGRAVFNIAGNKYRIVVWINYPYRVVYVRFIGTHRQHDGINAQTV